MLIEGIMLKRNMVPVSSNIFDPANEHPARRTVVASCADQVGKQNYDTKDIAVVTSGGNADVVKHAFPRPTMPVV